MKTRLVTPFLAKVDLYHTVRKVLKNWSGNTLGVNVLKNLIEFKINDTTGKLKAVLISNYFKFH